jgi:hypothetical protein
MADKVFYVHYRTEDSGAVTFALRPSGEVNSQTGAELIDAGVAFCAPRDQFSRARGRRIARGRIGVIGCERGPEEGVRAQLYGACERLVQGLRVDAGRIGADEARVPRWFPAWVTAWRAEGRRRGRA